MAYPPFYYMLLSPLAMIPYAAASIVWLTMLCAVAGFTAYGFSRFYPPAQTHSGKCLIACFAFYPLLMSLNMAHKSVVLLLIFTATYLLLYHRRPFLAGVTFGCIAFKPHLAIVVGLAMLIKRQWRFVGGSMFSLAILLLLSAVAGLDLCRDYFWQCLSLGDYSQTGGYLLTESHNLTGAIALSLGHSTLATVLGVILSIASVWLLSVTLRGPRDFRSRRFALQFSALILVTVLLSPHFYIYDLAILLLPLALLLLVVIEGKAPELKAKDCDSVALSAKTTFSMLRWTCLAMFVGAGLFTVIAERLSVQISLPIMLLLLFLMAQQANRYLRQSAIHNSAQQQWA